MKDLHRRRLKETKERAEALMRALGEQELGLPLQTFGWAFGFDRAKRRLGQCVWKRSGELVMRITLSRPHVVRTGLEHRDASGLAVIEDVVRHEIAHAIDYERRGRSGHDAAWKKICRRVGADPSRRYEGDGLSRVPGRYVATCPGCGAETDFYRRPERVRACRACCQAKSGGGFDERFKLVLRERRTGRRIAFKEELQRAPGAAGGRSPAALGYKYTGTCPKCGWRRGYGRRLKRKHACPRCCREHAGGTYCADYELEIVQHY